MCIYLHIHILTFNLDDPVACSLSVLFFFLFLLFYFSFFPPFVMSLLTFPVSISLLLSDILPHLRHNAGIKCVCLVFGLDKMSQTLTNVCHRIIVVVAAVAVAVAVAARVVTQKLPIIFQLANFVSSSADLNLFLFFCFIFFIFFYFFYFLPISFFAC